MLSGDAASIRARAFGLKVLFSLNNKVNFKNPKENKNKKKLLNFLNYFWSYLLQTELNMPKSIYYLFLLVFFVNCSKEPAQTGTTPTENLYFPPITGDTWETKSITDLGWKPSAVQPLLDYLALKNSKSFIILVNGKIVMENYFNGHSATTPWYWASAGKTLTSTLTGIAQQEGLININNKVSTYIGTGWTSETLAQENQITCKNLLTMTSGLDDTTDDVTPAKLIYKADAGTRWAYHNAYVKLQDVVASAARQTWSNYFNSKLRDKIGMTGAWIQDGNNSVYGSTTRSMARFGLLMLNKGKWDKQSILNEDYFNEATNTSQNINLRLRLFMVAKWQIKLSSPTITIAIYRKSNSFWS